MRDGVPGLTMAQQEAALVAAGVKFADVFRDKLSKAKIRKRDPADLRDRAEMLKPTPRRQIETIYVASLRVLGWNMGDIARALAAAGARNASVHAVDLGKTFTAATLDGELLEALAHAETERRRGQTAAGRSAAGDASRERAFKRRAAKLAKAKPLWALPSDEMSAREIAAKVGMSVRSLHTWLGPRSEAQKGKKP